MKRGTPPRTRPLRPGPPRARDAPLRRRTPLARGDAAPTRGPRAPADRPSTRRPGAASEAQRAKIVGGTCVVCGQTKGLTPAHLAPRSLGGCDSPACGGALCGPPPGAYAPGRLDLLRPLEPRWRTEIAHMV